MSRPQPKGDLRSKAMRHASIWSRALGLFFRNDGFMAAGNLAFLTMLSLFPFLIFLVALSGQLGQTERGLEAVAYVLDELPPEISKVLKGPINGIIRNTGAGILSTSILFAIWTAGSGVEAARGVFVKAFGRENAAALWRRRLESLAVVVLGALSVLSAMILLVVTNPLIAAFESLFPQSVAEGLSELIQLGATLVGPMLLAFGLYGMFVALTPRRVSKPLYWPGTLMALIVFFATAKGFSVYLQYAGGYDVTYGSLAGMIVTQLFCFFVSLGFVLGVELNAAYTHERGADLESETQSAD